MLRWKLKRLVPFRVDELRIGAVEVTPLPGQEEPRRLLLGFAVEALLAALEAAFERVGIRLGRISSTSLALLAALVEPAAGDGLTALVLAEGRGRRRRGRRQRLHPGGGARRRAAAPPLQGAAGGAAGGGAGRFRPPRPRPHPQLPGRERARRGGGRAPSWPRPPASRRAWLGWLEDGLGARAEALGPEHLPPRRPAPAPASIGASWPRCSASSARRSHEGPAPQPGQPAVRQQPSGHPADGGPVDGGGPLPRRRRRAFLGATTGAGTDQRQQLARVEAEIAGRAGGGRPARPRPGRRRRRPAQPAHRAGQREDRRAHLRLGPAVRPARRHPPQRRPAAQPDPAAPHRERRPAAAGGDRRRPGGAADRVRLEILGAARRDDAILELLDALFADPAFEDPNLANESKQQGEVRFSLSATYLPAAAPPPAAATADGDAAGRRRPRGRRRVPRPPATAAPPRAPPGATNVSALDRLRSLDWEPWRRGVARWLPALAVLVLAVGAPRSSTRRASRAAPRSAPRP